MASNSTMAFVIPISSGAIPLILDTLDSIGHYCSGAYDVIIIEDRTTDGTYEAIKAKQRKNWHVLRNERKHGIERLVHSLCSGFRFVLESLTTDLVLRLDQDALLIRPGAVEEAFSYMQKNPSTGIFGVYEVDYNRPRSYDVHHRLIDRELARWRRLLGRSPSWRPILELAEANGYRRGDNVFGGAYFITRECLTAISGIGGLGVPHRWHSRMQEDVYFSMAAVAAGYKMGHFAAPDGPLCLEWRGLPYPALEMWSKGFKIVHSVDKGPNAGKKENGGITAREVFRRLRYRSLD